MNSRTSGLGIAVLATLTLLIGFVAGSFFAASESVAPAFVAPRDAGRQPEVDANAAEWSSAPLARESVRVTSTSPATYRLSDDELTRARADIDVAPGPAPQGTARVTGRTATMRGEPLEGVVVVATLRSESDPYGEFSDGLGEGNSIDPSLDDVLARQAETWAHARGSRYSGMSGADGSYAIDSLPAGRYRVSAHKTGYLLEPIGDSYVEAGGTRDFAARPVVEFTANVRLPDGSEPPIAAIRTTRDGSTNTLRWTPERRVIRLPAADGSAMALAEFVTGSGYGSRAPARLRSAAVRLGDAQRTLDFQLAPQLGIYGRVLDPAGIGSARQVALLDLSRDPTVSAGAFAASSTRTQNSNGVFEFMGLAPGSYAIGLLGRGDSLLGSATVTVSDGLVEQDLELAPPNAADSIRVVCLSPDGTPSYGVEFRYAVYREYSRSNGRVSRVLQDPDGSYRIPIDALGNPEGRAEPALIRITARHQHFGRCSGDLAAGARELTLSFAEPCKLIVTVLGYAQSPYRGSLKVRLFTDTEKFERGGHSYQVQPDSASAELLDDGTAEFSNLPPGNWTAHLLLGSNRSSDRSIAEARVEVRAPTSQVSLSIPQLYDVVVQAPTLAPRTTVWMHAARDEGESAAMMYLGNFDASGSLDEQRRATFTRLTQGRYLVQANGMLQGQELVVPGGPYVLSAHMVDCVRVAISDESGVLYRAGLRPGDLVTSIDGVPFTADAWWRVLNERGSKKGVPLTLIRDGRTITLQGGDHPWNGGDLGGSYAPASREDS